MLIDGSRPRAIALMGPTASGKSAYALALAQRLDGEIVSVDSALVYRGLDIGAAKPTREEQAQAPHHLIDVREPWQPYSAAEFAADARRAIDGIVARGKLPILAGGTGLYFRALLEGLADMPEADEAMRAEISAEADERGWAASHAQLATVDPEAAEAVENRMYENKVASGDIKADEHKRSHPEHHGDVADSVVPRANPD